MEGGTFKPSLVWKDAAVADPVTGATRQISGVQDRKLVFDFLQDIPSWHSSLELGMQTGFKRPNFRIAQVNYASCGRSMSSSIGITSRSRIWTCRSSFRISFRISTT